MDCVPARVARLLTWVLLGAGLWLTPAAAQAVDTPGTTLVCRFSDPRLVEISGITWSRAHPGVYWVHNDSGGGPYLYAVDGRTCRTLARIRIGNIGARDIEAIATGTDPQGRPVLWVGDIGDNRNSWPSVRLHAVREPSRLVDQQVDAVTYRFTYPQGPSNAESILAEPGSARLWVVTKEIVAGGVHRVPLSTSTVRKAVRVAEVGSLVTDAAMSPDGRHYVIRDYLQAWQYDAPVGATSIAQGVPIELPAQPQGEAISYTADGSALLVASEVDTALWRVALPTASSTSTATSAPTTASSGAGSPPASRTPSASDDRAPGDVDGPAPGAWLLAGFAFAAALGLVGVASRRLRG
jgi:hypothetical protein